MFNHMENELVNNIVMAIQAHATPRPYDYDILHIAVTGVCVSAVFAFIAFLLNKRQINIAQEQIRLATEQQKISEKQTEIANKQAEIMEQQNKIALFEKRHNAFVELNKFITNMKHFYSKTQKLKDSEDSSSITFFLQGIFCASNENPHKYKQLTKEKVQVQAVNDLNKIRKTVHLIPLVFDLKKPEENELDELDKILVLSYKLIGRMNCNISENDPFSFHEITTLLDNYSLINREPSPLIKELYRQMKISSPIRLDITS